MRISDWSSDVCSSDLTAHGHDGLVDEHGYVLNDATMEVLVGQALVQAEAGADIVAPSDLMDGRVGRIRQALEQAGRVNVQIMARSEEHTSELQSLMRISYAVFCLKKNNDTNIIHTQH